MEDIFESLDRISDIIELAKAEVAYRSSMLDKLMEICAPKEVIDNERSMLDSAELILCMYKDEV